MTTKMEIKLLGNLRKTYSDELTKDHSEETKLKIHNLIEMMEAVTASLKKRYNEEKKTKLLSRLKNKIPSSKAD